MDKRVIDYIKKQKQNGYSNQSIKLALVKQGWPTNEINQAFFEANHQNNNSLNLNNKTNNNFKNKNNNEVKLERPLGITIISIFYFVFSLSCLFSSLYSIFSSNGVSSIPFIGPMLNKFLIIFSVLNLLLFLLYLFVGYGLLKLKKWARIVAIIFSIMTILTIVGIPIGVIFLIILFNNKTKEAFSN